METIFKKWGNRFQWYDDPLSLLNKCASTLLSVFGYVSSPNPPHHPGREEIFLFTFFKSGNSCLRMFVWLSQEVVSSTPRTQGQLYFIPKMVLSALGQFFPNLSPVYHFSDLCHSHCCLFKISNCYFFKICIQVVCRPTITIHFSLVLCNTWRAIILIC